MYASIFIIFVSAVLYSCAETRVNALSGEDIEVDCDNDDSDDDDYIYHLKESVAVIGKKMKAMESKITTLQLQMATMQIEMASVINRTTTCGNECPNRCQNGFIKLGNQCYYFSTDLKTVPEALSACQSLGSTLAYPKNSEENSLLKDYVRKNYKTLDWWLGGTDAAKEGTWVWMNDQTPIVYTDWEKGEPNNGGSTGIPENCVFIGGQWTPTFQWLDAPCNWDEAFICQEKI